MNIKKINQMFLITVLISLSAGLMPLGRMFPDYGVRLLFSEILLSAPGAAWIIAGKRNYAHTVRLKKIHGSTVVLLFLFYIDIMPLMGLINAISMLFVENVTADTMQQVVSGHSFPVSLVLIALLPAVFEESVYRGLFYNEYRKAAPIGGIVLSAFLFGIMHANWNQFSYAFVMGVIFCLIIEATDSILSSMLLHFFINGSSVVLLSVMDVLSEDFPEQVSQALGEAETVAGQTFGDILRMYLEMAIIGIIAAVVIYRQIAIKEERLEVVRGLFRRKKHDVAEERDAAGEGMEAAKGWENGEEGAAAKFSGKGTSSFARLFSVPLIVAIVLLLALMVLNEVM